MDNHKALCSEHCRKHSCEWPTSALSCLPLSCGTDQRSRLLWLVAPRLACRTVVVAAE